MQLLRLAAVILFALAAFAGFDVWIHSDVSTVLGVIASGLACLAAAGLVIPAPPSR